MRAVPRSPLCGAMRTVNLRNSGATLSPLGVPSASGTGDSGCSARTPRVEHPGHSRYLARDPRIDGCDISGTRFPVLRPGSITWATAPRSSPLASPAGTTPGSGFRLRQALQTPGEHGRRGVARSHRRRPHTASCRRGARAGGGGARDDQALDRVEHVDDLIDDIDQALAAAASVAPEGRDRGTCGGLSLTPVLPWAGPSSRSSYRAPDLSGPGALRARRPGSRRPGRGVDCRRRPPGGRSLGWRRLGKRPQGEGWVRALAVAGARGLTAPAAKPAPLWRECHGKPAQRVITGGTFEPCRTNHAFHVGWPGGIAPPGSHRSRRDGLPSPGSSRQPGVPRLLPRRRLGCAVGPGWRAGPLLHPHPRKQELHRYYEPVRQRAPHRYSVPSVAPRHAPSRDPTRPGPQYRRSPSHVPCKSRRPGSRRLYAGHRLANLRTATRLIPGDYAGPLVSMPTNDFDASTAHTPPRTPRPSASGTSSWSPPDPVKPSLFRVS